VLWLTSSGRCHWPVSLATGATGRSGRDGVDGRTGATGRAGSQGTGGRQGNTGATGVEGRTGRTGATGTKGSTGSAGAVGRTGSTGTAGRTGKWWSNYPHQPRRSVLGNIQIYSCCIVTWNALDNVWLRSVNAFPITGSATVDKVWSKTGRVQSKTVP